MSAELYCALCGWFLDQGNATGLFCYCFLVLTWNLMCRSSSTTRIQLYHIKWTSFDCMQVNCAHHNNNQMVDTASHPRKIYDNPSYLFLLFMHSHFTLPHSTQNQTRMTASSQARVSMPAFLCLLSTSDAADEEGSVDIACLNHMQKTKPTCPTRKYS